MDKELREAFIRAVNRAKNANKTPAVMGRYDSPGYTFTVPGGHGFTYVRIIGSGMTTLTMAINRAGVAETGDLPVWLDRGKDGRWYIIEERYEGT